MPKDVLCVEDSPDDFDLLSLAFRRCGIRNTLIQATNWDEALQHLESSVHRIGLIILDLNLPGLGGVEILDELKRRGINIPIIVMTTSDLDATRQTCLEKGAVVFLVKPTEFQGLLELLGRDGALASFLDIEPDSGDRTAQASTPHLWPGTWNLVYRLA